MPYDYIGTGMSQANYTGIDPYTRQVRTQAIPGRGSAVSTGPYDQSSALGSAYQAQSFNLGESGRLGQLTDLINTMNRNAQKTSLEARIPNAPALEAKSSENIAAEMRGEVPQDVMNLLGQQAAERGVATGSPGSPNANAAYLRALGLTSLQQEQTGQADLTRAYARNPAAPIFDPTTQLITPYQGALISEANASNNLGVNQLIQRGNIAGQELALDRLRYGNPSGSYGGPTGNPLTGQDLFGPSFDYTGGEGAGAGGGGGYGPFQPGDFEAMGFNDSPVYSGTPLTMFG